MDSLTTSPLTIYALVIASGIGLAFIVRLLLDYLERRFNQLETQSLNLIIIRAIKAPLYLTILFLTLVVLIFFLDLSPYTQQLCNQLILTILLFIWFGAALNTTGQIVQAATVRFERKYHANVVDTAPFLSSILKTLFFIFSLYLFFLIWHLDLTPLIAFMSIIGAALSFAARDTIGNIISGVSIFVSRPFKVKDYIIINEDLSGQIYEIGLQQTKLVTPENNIVIIPNTQLVTKPLTNINTLKTNTRHPISFSVPAGADLPAVYKILNRAASANKWLAPGTKPLIHLKDFTPTQANLEIIVYLEKPAYQNKVTHQILTQSNQDLVKAGIIIPKT